MKRLFKWLAAVAAGIFAILVGVAAMQRRRQRTDRAAIAASLAARRYKVKEAMADTATARKQYADARRNMEERADEARTELERLDARIAARRERIRELLGRHGL